MKKILPVLSVIAFAFGTFAFPANADDEPKLLNDTCPVKGESVEDGKTVEYTASFCCGKCVSKFEKDPSKYVGELANAEEGKCPFSGKDLDPEATATVVIGVCCGGCEKKVTADPDKYIKEIAKES